MALKSYRELEVWQRAMDLVVEIYKMSKAFPNNERFGLTAQIQRSATSIPANIAQGYGRAHRKEYLQHLSIARGSLMETETHLVIAVRLKYIDLEKGNNVWELLNNTSMMLNKLIASLK